MVHCNQFLMVYIAVNEKVRKTQLFITCVLSLLQDNNLKNTIITRLQQKELFKITYRNEAKEAKRLVNKYYKISWGPLYKKIKEILVDLKYRGDFRPRSKRQAMGLLRAAVKSNSLRYLKRVMGTKRLRRNVPKYRFIARRDYLN